MLPAPLYAGSLTTPGKFLLAGTAGSAIYWLVPWHAPQKFGHETDIREAGEREACAGECGEEDPIRADEEGESRGGQHQQACSQSNLAFQGPAGSDAPYDRKSCLNPSAGSAFEHRELKRTGLEKAGGHTGALAHL